MKLLINLLYAVATLISYPSDKTKTMELADMKAEWHYDNEEICIELTSPGDGWMAIGFNNKEGLVGSNLIMAAHINNKTTVEDQYVVALGQHPKVSSLGGESHIATAEIIKHAKGQNLSLRIKTNPEDDYHHSLEKNRRVYMTLAFSTSKDFNHHSLKRDSKWINL